MAEDVEGDIAHLMDGLHVANKTMEEQNSIDSGKPKGYTRLGSERISLGDIDELNRTDKDVPDQRRQNEEVAQVVKRLKEKLNSID